MSTPLTIREDIAAEIRTALAAAEIKCVVYPYPAETLALPAVVFVPDEPWWTPARFTDGKTVSGIRCNFELQIVTPRTEVEESVMAATEAIAATVAIALHASPVARWDDLGQPSESTVNDIACMVTPLSCHAIV